MTKPPEDPRAKAVQLFSACIVAAGSLIAADRDKVNQIPKTRVVLSLEQRVVGLANAIYLTAFPKIFASPTSDVAAGEDEMPLGFGPDC